MKFLAGHGLLTTEVLPEGERAEMQGSLLEKEERKLQKHKAHVREKVRH